MNETFHAFASETLKAETGRLAELETELASLEEQATELAGSMEHQPELDAEISRKRVAVAEAIGEQKVRIREVTLSEARRFASNLRPRYRQLLQEGVDLATSLAAWATKEREFCEQHGVVATNGMGSIVSLPRVEPKDFQIRENPKSRLQDWLLQVEELHGVKAREK